MNGFDEEYNAHSSQPTMSEDKAAELNRQALTSLESNPRFKRQGLAALGMTAEWEKARQKNEEDIRNKFYKGDEDGYQRFLSKTVDIDMKTRDSISRYEDAQVLHGMRENMKARRKTQNAKYGEAVMTGSAATIYQMAQELERDHESFVAVMNGKQKEFNDWLATKPDVEDPKNKQTADEYVKKLAAIKADYEARHGVTQTKFDTAVKTQTEGIRNWYAKNHRESYEEYRRLGHSDEESFYLASNDSAEDAEAMLKNLIDSGMGVAVQGVLDALKDPYCTRVAKKNEDGTVATHKVAVLGDDGNVRTDDAGKPLFTDEIDYEPTTFDQSRRLFMGMSKVNELQDYLDSKIKAEAAKAKLLGQQNERAWTLAASSIMVTADRLSTEPELDMEKMAKLMNEAQALQDAGYKKAHQVSTHLASIVRSAERKSEKIQRDSEKLETVADFQREYDNYIGFVNKSAPIAFFMKTGQIKSPNGNFDVARDVDGQNRMILLIRNGQSRGILKGPVWEARLKKLTEDRASEDYDAAMIAISNAGIAVDENASQSLREAFGTRSADIAEELGTSALKSIWGKDENGRLKLVNSKYMMYTWNDPKTGKAVPLSGDEMNQLLKVVSDWQKRHVNPSPNGQPSQDLNDFISGVLKTSVRRKTISHWFSADEVGVPFAFSDIELAGRRAIQTYFTGDKTKGKEYNMREFYDRDLSLLETATVNGSLPTQSQVIQALRNRLGK